MQIQKNGRLISCLDEWRALAPPKREDQWEWGRSAYELARAWCGTGTPAMPPELRALLDSCDVTRGLQVKTVTPEARIRFDKNRGEPRNADLAFIGETSTAKVAVTVEAKADEPFGETVETALENALERLVENPRSRGVRRVEGLAGALFRSGNPKLAILRYQLLTAAAGTLALASREEASVAVLVIHEFITDQTTDEKHARNAIDFGAFLTRLNGSQLPVEPSRLLGPFRVPGGMLFASPPPLWIGKITTNRRTCAE